MEWEDITDKSNNKENNFSKYIYLTVILEADSVLDKVFFLSFFSPFRL